ncbi:hypothetical protein QFZ77_007274 [Paenibacillus sp. V4I3]|nr:hypothetical protein [Paenibacillus sp. V4I3]MDQ0885527.1 hypothetical protein [Paenibacillus sp. V4I9]
MIIGNRITLLREEPGLAQKELACKGEILEHKFGCPAFVPFFSTLGITSFLTTRQISLTDS